MASRDLPGAPFLEAVGAGASDFFPCGFVPLFMAANTSPFNTIPRGPVPCICDISKPLSISSLRTDGPTLPVADEDTIGTTGGAELEDFCTSGAFGACPPSDGTDPPL